MGLPLLSRSEPEALGPAEQGGCQSSHPACHPEARRSQDGPCLPGLCRRLAPGLPAAFLAAGSRPSPSGHLWAWLTGRQKPQRARPCAPSHRTAPAVAQPLLGTLRASPPTQQAALGTGGPAATPVLWAASVLMSGALFRGGGGTSSSHTGQTGRVAAGGAAEAACWSLLSLCPFPSASLSFCSSPIPSSCCGPPGVTHVQR